MRSQNLRTISENSRRRQRSPHTVLYAMAIVVVALFIAGSQARPQTKSAAPAGDAKGNAENGKRLFTSSGCYECHGREAQGSRYSGPRLGPDPISLPAFRAYIRAPKGQMPPYTGKVLTDAELADIHAFLESLPEPPAAKTIPLLN
jgi:ubiquinol-cytochrome c reductase cytochrome c subunit